MSHRKGAVWTERVVLALILASLGGTLNLVLVIHRRVQSASMASKGDMIAPPSPPAAPKPSTIVHQPAAPPPPAPRKPVAPPAAPRPVEDPTAPILARLDGAIARESEAAREADRRTDAMEASRRSSIAESERWKRREMLVRQQVSALAQRAEKLEQDAITLDAERDVLARERDALKAAIGKDSQRTGYAVLPYKGPNGTWRRPIVLECSGNTVKLQPHGPAFSPLELSPLIHPRSSPVVLAIAREMMHIQQAETPDGAPAVPYLVFLVRPDGIRPYYLARGRLESLGIAFGYELIEQDLAVEIPDFDDVRTWDGSKPLPIEREDAKTGRPWPATAGAAGAADVRRGSAPGTWPQAEGGQAKPGSDRRGADLARGDGPGGRTGGSGASRGGLDRSTTSEIDLGGSAMRGGRPSNGSNDGSPDDFVWPTTSGGTSPTGSQRSGRTMGRASADEAGTGGGFSGMPPVGAPGRGPGSSSNSPSPDGGGFGSDSIARGRLSPGGVPGGDSKGDGTSSRDREAGRLLAGAGDTGRASVSISGAGGGGRETNSGRENSTASGSGNPDPLPELQPARDGAAAFGTPMSGGPSGGGRSGGGPAPRMGGSSGSAAGAIGTPLPSQSGRPGDATIPGGPNGPTGADRGFAPYASGAGPASPGRPGSGFGNPIGSPNADATSRGPGSSPITESAQNAASGGDPSKNGAAGGPNGSSTATDGANPPGTSSTTIAGLGGSGSSAPDGSSPPVGAGSMAGSGSSTAAGQPPTLLGPALSAGSPSSSPPPSSALGELLSRASDTASTATGDATGIPSSNSGASSSVASSSLSSLAGAGSTSLSGGGQPPSSTSAGASGMSLPSFSMSPDPNSEPDALKELALPPISTHRQPGAIDVPFEIVAVCRRDDVLLHPGGYRITAQSLQTKVGKGDSAEPLFQRELKSIVRRRAQVDPMIRPKPRLKFLVEGGGSNTFWTARQQLTFSNLDWPMSVQVAGPQTGYLLDERIRR